MVPIFCRALQFSLQDFAVVWVWPFCVPLIGNRFRVYALCFACVGFTPPLFVLYCVTVVGRTARRGRTRADATRFSFFENLEHTRGGFFSTLFTLPGFRFFLCLPCMAQLSLPLPPRTPPRAACDTPLSNSMTASTTDHLLGLSVGESSVEPQLRPRPLTNAQPAGSPDFGVSSF